MVAVALGDDVGDGFRSMGVQEVVVGGQTMNPSTADLLEAIEATDADEVVVLPNNKNIVPVAGQAAALAGKPVRVVPTRGMVAGLAAMMVYDADAPADANAKAMEEAASQVVSGQVTWAVRDSGEINEGDWLGLADDEIVVVHPDLVTCATRLLDRLVERRPRAGHRLRGGDDARRDHRRVRRVAGRQPPRGLRRGPTVAPPPVGLPLLHRVSHCLYHR